MVLINLQLSAQETETADYYWISFTDKEGTEYSIDQPLQFLSPRALDRRFKHGVKIDAQDLPVSQVYLDSLISQGATIIHHSKWLNGSTIKATKTQLSKILTFSFVQEAELTKPGVLLKSASNKFADEIIQSEIDTIYYGTSVFQIGQLNGQFLHNNNHLGQGIHIAVLDAGFYLLDELPSFQELRNDNRIILTRDFVDPGSNVFLADDHGMNVLSTMAGELPGFLIGTAPKASYYLFRSEDAESEYLIEEDNWVVAAEYADSLGVDIINSSLGYSVFEDKNMNHQYAELDGKTTRVTQAANIAVQKGMLVFSSAGNKGNDSWRYLVAPSDGDLVIGVGAVDKNNMWAPFSSIGPSSDGDTKPNVAAMGLGSIVQKSDGSIGMTNGTSFSSPILAGMAACLWQAFPDASNMDIKNAIEQSASQYLFADTLIGFGIPNFETAVSILEMTEALETTKNWQLSPNPFRNQLQIYRLNNEVEESVRVIFFKINGQKVWEEFFAPGQPLFFRNLSNLPDGINIVHIESAGKSEFHKLLKISNK